jgi:glutamyl-tRNA synthetase
MIEFMLEQGPSKRANLMEWEKIWAINKRIIDPICPRYSAVSVEKASKIIVTNGPKEPEVITVLCNKLNPALGERPQWKSNELLIEFDDADQIVAGEKVTLMNWGNFQIHTKEAQPDGSFLLTAEYLPEDKDFKKTKKLTWLANNTNLLVANLFEFDHLMKSPKIEETDKFEDLVNVNSIFKSKIYTDSHIRTLHKGTFRNISDQFLQFERRCYARIDKVTINGGDVEVDIFLVPDGKKVGLASVKTNIDKKGDIKKKDLSEKVEDKKNKDSKKEKEKKKKEAATEEQKVEQKVEVKAEQKTEEVEVKTEAKKE